MLNCCGVQYNSESQQQEFVRQLDLHQRNGMNAVVVQVRPSADAFYPSPYEPWSQWLTGTQGKAPFPYYDPMQFTIEEAHKRGFEYHAWVNPYRANFSIAASKYSGVTVTALCVERSAISGGRFSSINPLTSTGITVLFIRSAAAISRFTHL